MKKYIFFWLLLISVTSFAQADTINKILRAFPITDYMLDLNDSTKLVQIEMPENLKLKDKQIGLLYGVYENSSATAIQKGYGKCQLIKGNYYYFAISNNSSGQSLVKGDLLYTFMEKTKIYNGQIPQLAAHFIRLLDVYETALYDRYTIFLKWSREDENEMLDSIVADIRFTGNYFIKENPSMDVLIQKGDYKGRKTLYVMAECQQADVIKFLDYMIARPRNYAGKEWKVSEIFATWLSEGAPTVLKE